MLAESIRKLSLGSDWKTAMHYILGQAVMNGDYTIEYIENCSEVVKVWIRNNERGEIVCWKSFSKNLPISLENNIDF